MPPSNWLSNSIDSYGLQHALCNASGFASFQMAQMFPDCMGEVDVVTAAENIKHLLKLPYTSKSAVSMIVHRIENTLLIDDFDIHKYLLRQSDDDWNWMRTFILDNIINNLSEKDLQFFLKYKSRDFLHQKNLNSKFLYHSLEINGSKDENDGSSTSKKSDQNAEQAQKNFDLIQNIPKSGPILPEPNIEENLPDSKSHTYNRNVLWTFEDIRMLIGTDMPIFGGGTRPCISLRLRDMKKPINVLTGIDYWLDNLMCNVPEVVMCYHLDGIVQKYELVKTEDLPNLEDSQFSPKIIRNVAQNILSFLKSNATKSGHTYWLFKGRNDDVVKLYDLTTLCSDNTDKTTHSNAETNTENNEKAETPFTIPVAMLLYTVARNMKNSKEKLTAKKAGAIKALLDNCIKLLPKEKYPQIVTSSYYLLSDLHIPADLIPGSPEFCSTDDDSSDDENNDDDNESTSSSTQNNQTIAMKMIQETIEDYRLDENTKNNMKPPPLTGSVKERCDMALKNILKGLDCLQYFESNEEQILRDKIRHEADNPKMAKPNQPIPLPYEPLKNLNNNMAEVINPEVPIALGWKPINLSKRELKKKQQQAKRATAAKSQEASDNVNQNNSPRSLILRNENSWNSHLNTLLIEKTCLTYATLAESYYTSENYGSSLRYFYIALRCQQILTQNKQSMKSHKSDLLGRVGDCFFQIANHWNHIESYLIEFDRETTIDTQIESELLKENTFDDDLPKPVNNIEHLMRTSCACYEAALDCVSDDSKNELLRRLGNARNELGVLYIKWTEDEFLKYHQNSEKFEKSDKTKEIVYQTLAYKAYDCLMKGINIFDKIKDAINLALLLNNMGKFMRLRAHIYLPGEVKDDPNMMKKFYNEAFGFYNRALGVLGERKVKVDLWDDICWQLSTSTFNLAVELQDNTFKSDGDMEDIESEMVELLKKALTYCDTETTSSKQILYAFRSGSINHR